MLLYLTYTFIFSIAIICFVYREVALNTSFVRVISERCSMQRERLQRINSLLIGLYKVIYLYSNHVLLLNT